jgi:DNA-directed RNA polymerase omega subunit
MSIASEETVVETNGHRLPVDSIYRLIIIAGIRSKQLQRGSQPRIVADPLKRKYTSIALEEIRQGLVSFTVNHQVAVEVNAEPQSNVL